MSVTSTITLRVQPAHRPHLLELVGEGKQIQERHGARVRVYHATIGGEPNSVSVGVELPDMAAFGTYVDKLTADPDWQSFYQRVSSGERGEVELISSALYQEIDL